MQQVTILGATGSIGTSSLNVISQHPTKYSVYAVTANTNVEKMLTICQQYQPRYAVMSDKDSAQRLKLLLNGSPSSSSTRVIGGKQALLEVASDEEVDTVIAAIVGSVGLMPTLAAVRSAKRVLLANKDSLVIMGVLFMKEVAQHKACLFSLDS